MTTEEKIAELINIRDNFNYTLAPREVFDDAIRAMQNERSYFPPCEDCHKKMDEIREAYDKLKT